MKNLILLLTFFILVPHKLRNLPSQNTTEMLVRFISVHFCGIFVVAAFIATVLS
jgi:hypothetical protein